MKSEDNIQKLFDGEEQLPETQTSQSLPIISAASSNNDETIFQRLREIEKREFTRVDIADKKLEVKFINGAQFARQYIENISLGGLFIRTDQKHAMGEMVPITFEVPSEKEKIVFSINGKVCRVTTTGLGLEFTNLPAQTRIELESFVRSVLPKNVPVVAKPRQSTVENLEKIRDIRSQTALRRKKFAQHVAIFLGLLSLNLYLIDENIQDQFVVTAFKNQSVKIGDRNIPVTQIQSVERFGENEWILRLANQTTVPFQPDKVERQLPEYLQHSIRLLKTTPLRKEPRRSLNTRGLSNLHR